MSVTLGSPLVIVPVLSSAIICILPRFSSDSLVLKSIPFFAPIPFPTIIATGVASPKAQGQDITSTDIPRARAKLKSCFPNTSHKIVTTNAIAITAGTNTPDTLSAILAIGALVAAASETIFIILLSVVSSPTRSALHISTPDSFVVAAETLSSTFLSIGIDSPVNADSFTAETPSMTTPSTGMFSPGKTLNISPIFTSSIGTTLSTPSTTSLAVFGASFISDLSASVVLPFDIASSVFPMVIRQGIMAADSKYKSL